MFFYTSLQNNVDELESFYLLEEEMSKYKTLHHESLAWDKVYEYAYLILSKHSLELKICNYFCLSCLHIKSEEGFKALLALFTHIKKLLNENNAYMLSQKRKIQNLIQNFIQEYNKAKINLAPEYFDGFVALLAEFEKLLACHFTKLEANQAPAPISKTPARQIEAQNKNDTMKNLNEREYKSFCQKLAFELLEEDENNLSAYTLFAEAMWGKIKHLPECNSEKITAIPKPDADMIHLLLAQKPNDIDHIKCFISNLIFNPFWLEGVQLFGEFLEKRKKDKPLHLLTLLTSDFISKFNELKHLRFQNGDSFCKEEVYHYFMKPKQDQKSFFAKQSKDNTDQTQQDFEQRLMSIERENSNNTLINQVSALLEMAKTFETKQMKKNAKILYMYLVELMEKTLLKDYLAEEYERAKNKIK